MARTIKVVKEKDETGTHYSVQVDGKEYTWGHGTPAAALKQTLEIVLHELDKAQQSVNNVSEFKTAMIKFLGKG